jgi:anti-sigma factor RsiW
MPGCDKVLLVQAELDGELDAAQAAALEAHRAACAICQLAQAELLRARDLLRGETYEPIPDDVRARIMARLRQAEPRTAPTPARRRLWVFPSISGFGLGAVCAAAISLLILLPQRDDLAGQLVAGHIRALQPGHLEDVVSTDQHTVKPWFAGKIDFSPRVEDFKDHGYPLAGGRLDVLDGRPAAVLVFRRGGHIINVFMQPEADFPGSSDERMIETYHGYHLCAWNDDALHYCAVSDLAQEGLEQFVALWQKQP